MAHCQRESLHAQWSILLDDRLLEAYEHGIVSKCCYSITRRFYPRFLTYSADYKEKYASLGQSLVAFTLTKFRVMISCIRNGGICFCPRCLIPRLRVQNLGMKLDMKQRQTLARVGDESTRRLIQRARDIIYKKNYAVDTDAVEAILKGQSLVPTLVSLKILSSNHHLTTSSTAECVYAEAWRLRSFQDVGCRSFA